MARVSCLSAGLAFAWTALDRVRRSALDTDLGGAQHDIGLSAVSFGGGDQKPPSC